MFWPKLHLFIKKAKQFLSKHRAWLVLVIAISAIKIFAPSTFLILGYAGLFYLIFYPIIKRLQSVLRSNRLSILVFLLAISLLIVFVMIYLIPALINQIIAFSSNYPELQASVINQINTWQKSFEALNINFLKITNISAEGVSSRYISQSGQAILVFFDGIVKSLSGILTSALQIFVAFVVSIYLLFERKTIFKFFNLYFEKKASLKEKKLLSLAYAQVVAYFTGIIFLSGLAFVSAWIFLSLIGLKFALLFAIWTGIMQFIPVFGPLLAAIPVILIAWTQSSTLVLATVVFFLILQIVLSNILAPIILGKESQLSPILVFIIMLVGAELFGILGMIVSIPVASLALLVWKVYPTRS